MEKARLFIPTCAYSFSSMKSLTRLRVLRLRYRRFALLLVECMLGLALMPRLPAAEKLQFNRDIRPILSDRCFKCHGPDKASRKASLRLDHSEDAYAERKKSHLP